jgi:hypothetical protein
MKIAIAQKLRPYSHIPGAMCALPGTRFIVEAFPTLIRIENLEIPIGDAPAPEFTLQQDLESNCVWVFSKKYRLRIKARADGIECNDRFFPIQMDFHLPEQWERLSLGKQKAQDWDLVWRRFDLAEILPVLYGLGQKIPAVPPQPHTGTARLLDGDLEPLCRAAFHKILVPRLRDDQRQGYCADEQALGNPFYLLQEAAQRIRSRFFRQQERRLRFFPDSSFPAGRMTNVQAPGIGTLDFEWSKRRLRRAIIRAVSDGETLLEGCSFRMKTDPKEKGKRRAEAFFAESGKTYFLDQFS